MDTYATMSQNSQLGHAAIHSENFSSQKDLAANQDEVWAVEKTAVMKN